MKYVFSVFIILSGWVFEFCLENPFVAKLLLSIGIVSFIYLCIKDLL